jgi:hypothetical protein
MPRRAPFTIDNPQSTIGVRSGRVAELADAQDLGSCPARDAGSTPAPPTIEEDWRLAIGDWGWGLVPP